MTKHGFVCKEMLHKAEWCYIQWGTVAVKACLPSLAQTGSCICLLSGCHILLKGCYNTRSFSVFSSLPESLQSVLPCGPNSGTWIHSSSWLQERAGDRKHHLWVQEGRSMYRQQDMVHYSLHWRQNHGHWLDAFTLLSGKMWHLLSEPKFTGWGHSSLMQMTPHLWQKVRRN